MAVVAVAALPIVMGCFGFVMALLGRGHWTWTAVCWSALGVIYVLYVRTYRTEFTASEVQQYRLLRRMQSCSYSDIENFRIGKGLNANSITMTLTAGRKMTVYGSGGQLIEAQLLLSDKLARIARGPV
jgi:hypothetical protein